MSDEVNNNFRLRSKFIYSAENDVGSSENITQSSIFVISDTHFFHNNILTYEAESRKFGNIEEMNEAIIRNWNSKVGKNDLIIHLGDFSFGGNENIDKIVKRLNGKIWILLGNHDREKRRRKFNWIEHGFDRVLRHPFLMDDRFIFSHEPLETIPDGKINIYGHVHASKYYNTIDENRLCACVERWNMSPIEYDYIKSVFKEKNGENEKNERDL